MKKRNKHTEREKEVRAWQLELNRLRRARFNLGYISLEKPIRDGWYRHLRLRDDVGRRKDVAVFMEILQVCGLRVRARSKPKADELWSWWLNRNNSINYPGIRRLRQTEYEQLSPRAQKWFVSHGWYWRPATGFQKRYYCTVPRYYFQPKYTRAYITERKILDPEIEARMQYLENRLEGTKYFRYSRYGYGHRYYGLTPHKRQRKRGKRLLKQFNEEEFFKRIYHP